MLVMFVLITIIFSDLGYYEEEKESKALIPETTISSSTVEKDKTEAMDVP